MAALQDASPIDALEVVSAQLRPAAPARFPIENAPAGFLAEPLELEPFEGSAPEETAGTRRAACNGYALPPSVREGDSCRILGTVCSGGLAPGSTAGEERPPSGSGAVGPAIETARADVWRVETGALLPSEAARIVPPADVAIVGTDRIRVLRLPPEGHGVLPANTVASSKAPGRFAPGTPLDARLRATLQARGVREVALRRPYPVGFATIGDELIDLSASREAGGRHDVIAPALEALIARCGVVGLPLGILPDSPPKLREAILRARDRRAEVLILAGGVGDGITDRTRETLQRLEAHMLVDGISLQGATGFLVARFQGLDLLCLSGRPLAAQAQIDLLARPALLARLGARRPLWDWSRVDWPASLSAPGLDAREAPPAGWSVWPAALRPSPSTERGPRHGGRLEVMAWEASNAFSLLEPGQEGWAVIPPGPLSAPSGELRAYFQPS